MVKISVVVPVYNVEKTLKRCIDSILNQTFQDFELILVNDGSLDSSGIMCDEYKQLDSRIKVIHKENGGLSSARNTGIESAAGEYIAFVDSDDYIDKNMYAVLYQFIAEENADIACCTYQICNEEESPVIEKTTPLKEVYGNRESIKKVLGDNKIHVYAWNKLYKLKLFKHVRYPQGKLYEDCFITYKLFSLAEKVVYTNYVGYFYMNNPKSITKQKFTLKHFDRITEKRRVVNDMQKNYPDLMEFAYGNLAIGYVTTAHMIFKSVVDYHQMDKNSQYYIDMVVRDLKRDFAHLVRNKQISKKFKLAILLLCWTPGLYSSIYIRFKRSTVK